MANEEHLSILRQGVEAWNRWRAENPKVRVDLREAELKKANLTGANLRRANLRRANLAGANLRRANLYGAYLEGANLYQADLTGADLYKADFDKADLTGADLTGADLRGVGLYGADLGGANLYKANLRGVSLHKANLEGANLSKANLTWAYLSGVDLTGVKIDDTTVLDDKWRLVWEIVTQGGAGRNLEGADLQGANLKGADLYKANLTGADLTESNLKGANLYKAHLTGADLRRANLTGADLTGAKLTGANLIGADLTEADLYGADLREADLRGAILPEKGLQGSFNRIEDIPKRPVGKEEAQRFITWLLDAGEYILTFTVAAIAADYAVKLSRAVYGAIRAKLAEDQTADFLPVKCLHPTTQVEIILLLDADFLRNEVHFGAADLDALMSWLFKRYDEIVGSSQVKTVFFRMTREEPYWELDSFIDQAGSLIEV